MAEDGEDGVAAERNPWHVRAWRGFNRWRRTYWLTRVLILLLIFGMALVERLAHVAVIYNLVGIAIQAIQFDSEPKIEYYEYTFLKAREAVRLRHLLLREFHADPYGRLTAADVHRAEAVGLDASQLVVPAPDADLDQLARAAQALGLVPASYSLNEVREEAFYAARAKTAEMVSRNRREVEAVLNEYYTWPDYGKWETWRYGLSRFFSDIAEVALALGVGLWLLLCFLAGFSVSVQFRRRRLAGLIAGAGTGAALYCFSVGIPQELGDVLRAPALLCSSAAVGLWAGGLAQRVRRPRLAASVCTAAGGVALALSGLLRTQEMGGYLGLALKLPPLSQWVQGYGGWANSASVRIVVGLLLILAAGGIAASALIAAAHSRRWARQD